VRLSLAGFAAGTGRASDGAGTSVGVDYASASLAVGLNLRLADRWSVEANAGLGLTLLWYKSTTLIFDPPIFTTSGHIWIVTPGAAGGVVLHLSEHGALVLEGRAVWLLPPPGFMTNSARVGGSSWPALAAALALRITL
jgi:hypothetical protein